MPIYFVDFLAVSAHEKMERPFGPPVAVRGKFLGPALFERQGLPVGPYKMLLLRAILGCLDCLGPSGLLF